MSDTTLIQRLRNCANEPWKHALRPIALEAAAALEQQAAQIEALQLTKAGLIGSLREEMDEGLRLRELGGALPDENITAMTERLIGERAALAAELSALRSDAERMRMLTCKCVENSADATRYRLLRRGQQWSVIDGIGDDLRADALDARIDAALRQEQPNHFPDAGKMVQPAGEQPT